MKDDNVAVVKSNEMTVVGVAAETPLAVANTLLDAAREMNRRLIERNLTISWVPVSRLVVPLFAVRSHKEISLDPVVGAISVNVSKINGFSVRFSGLEVRRVDHDVLVGVPVVDGGSEFEGIAGASATAFSEIGLDDVVAVTPWMVLGVAKSAADEGLIREVMGGQQVLVDGGWIVNDLIVVYGLDRGRAGSIPWEIKARLGLIMAVVPAAPVERPSEEWVERPFEEPVDSF